MAELHQRCKITDDIIESEILEWLNDQVLYFKSRDRGICDIADYFVNFYTENLKEPDRFDQILILDKKLIEQKIYNEVNTDEVYFIEKVRKLPFWRLSCEDCYWTIDMETLYFNNSIKLITKYPNLKFPQLLAVCYDSDHSLDYPYNFIPLELVYILT